MLLCSYPNTGQIMMMIVKNMLKLLISKLSEMARGLPDISWPHHWHWLSALLLSRRRVVLEICCHHSPLPLHHPGGGPTLHTRVSHLAPGSQGGEGDN